MKKSKKKTKKKKSNLKVSPSTFPTNFAVFAVSFSVMVLGGTGAAIAGKDISSILISKDFWYIVALIISIILKEKIKARFLLKVSFYFRWYSN
ncbi:MAG: hypothetical protein ACOH5I_26030 [Oligoflexus sp.]